MIRLIIFLLPVFICSCHNEQSHTYAIKDFRKQLQPYLTRIVSTGIVMYEDSALENMATDKELIQLTQSEHPVLRAAAFREIVDRKSFNHFDILMNHLDDTADVLIDRGEFGIWSRNVSDDFLEISKWKTREEKNKTIERLMTKHNYLRCAYTILERLEPQEKYYLYIKDMATRPRRLDGDFELDFDDKEYAMYGLAKFRKQEDVSIIKDQLMRYAWKLSDVSFRLMKEYPDTAYLDVLQRYHRRQFHKFSGNRPGGFTGFVADRAAPEDFTEALVVQQNERSAILLDTVLNRLRIYNCMPDRENVINEVIIQIWEHPCLAYARLREKIRTRAEEILKSRISFPIDTSSLPVDSTKSEIGWYD